LGFLKTLRLSFFFSNTARAKNPKQRGKKKLPEEKRKKIRRERERESLFNKQKE
jgi:hypothetical protein